MTTTTITGGAVYRAPNGEPAKVTTKCGPSMAKESFADECDINRIVQRYNETGLLTHENKAKPDYADFTGRYKDLHGAMNFVNEVNQKFANLPANLRARFNNDSAQYYRFVTDASNAEEMVQLGLAIKRDDPNAPIPVQVTNPPAESPPKE